MGYRKLYFNRCYRVIVPQQDIVAKLHTILGIEYDEGPDKCTVCQESHLDKLFEYNSYFTSTKSFASSSGSSNKPNSSHLFNVFR